jgi:hypothetical protein
MTISNNPVDRLGALLAQQAELEKVIKAIKAELVASGETVHEGTLFRATVSTSERAKLDLDAVREKLSPQFLRAHTSFTPVTTVRVVARNGERVAA